MTIAPSFSAASTPADDNDSIMKIEDGDKVWRNNKGEIHRTDGPAAEYADGSKEWWINGKRHRTDGPAIETTNGLKAWWINDKLHRADGPAIEHVNGSKRWYFNGKYHRTDGPAVEHADGSKEWWINGEKLTKDEINAHLEDLAAKKKAHAEATGAAHQKTLARINQLAGRVTRNRGNLP